MSDSQLGIVLRPTTFEQVVGQEDVIRTLQAKLDKGEVPRSIMFVGPAGTGKTTLAKIIARAVQGWDFPQDSEPEMLEINAANYTGVDAMRDLVDATYSYPMIGKYRVILLDEAHMLTKQAQNLLLKPMEAKDSACVWIICTTETAKIIPPLVTRCQVYTLSRMSKKDIHTLLDRAATHLGHGDYSDFEAKAIRENLDQPRALLNAFENYHNGMPATDAVNSQLQTFTANHFEIAKAVVYGSWTQASTVWRVPCKSVKDLLTDLEEAFKKGKEKDKSDAVAEVEGEEQPDTVEQLGRPEAARAIRAIVASLLKGMVIKQASLKAAESLHIISHCAPPSAFDTGLEYPATIGGLLRVNMKMTGK